ncbi:DinB family protein [Neokomagataea anthophila]|uniref:DinB family protein n=1 Tax=Neokomagataea anthophila TaxID=2826925 RepID=A0ABS5E5A4_9PROT|nr:DinB family protein [Neokomagataea anthophila]MBR0559077.1 DinB family protein [Neokomagataea anthophila]
MVRDMQDTVSLASHIRVNTLMKLLEYKKWADDLACHTVKSIPQDEAFRVRKTTFDNIVRTMNHSCVVEDIFKHHLLGIRHTYQTRNTEHTPSVDELVFFVERMNDWYLAHVGSWRDDDLDVLVHFEFLNGRPAAMTREDIVLHIVNHATYHRGFVGDMLKQIPHDWPSNDFTVFVCPERGA